MALKWPVNLAVNIFLMHKIMNYHSETESYQIKTDQNRLPLNILAFILGSPKLQISAKHIGRYSVKT